MRLLYIILCNLIFSNYSIIQSDSMVRYSGSHPTHGFSGISSSVTIDSDCVDNNDVCDLIFKVPIISLNSGNDNRDSNMLNYLKAFSYPYIEVNFPDFLVKGYENDFIQCEIMIAGITKSLSIPLSLFKNNNNQYKVYSSFEISLKDFNIDLPKLLFIPIDSNIIINVDLLIAVEGEK